MSKVKLVSGEDERFFPRMKRIFEINKKYRPDEIAAVSYQKYNKNKEVKAMFIDKNWNYKNIKEIENYDK